MPRACTKGRCARAATRTSFIRSASRTSSPTCGSTARASARPCCTTSSRTPSATERRHRGAVRRGDRVSRRRRHQARQDQLHLEGGPAGRELPQDARGDGARHPRAAGQARRPPRQHAHARAHEAGDRRSASPGRRSRSTRRSPTASASSGSRASSRTCRSSTSIPKQYAELAQASRRSAATRPREVHRRRRASASRAHARRARLRGRGRRAASRTSTRIWRKMKRQTVRLRPDLRLHRVPRRRGERGRLLRGARRRSTRSGRRFPGASRTTSRCPSPTCTSRCTPR